jgi:hypothetical protein
MKIPKEKPVCQDGGFQKHQENESKSFLKPARTKANSLKYSKDILKKQEFLQNIL